MTDKAMDISPEDKKELEMELLFTKMSDIVYSDDKVQNMLTLMKFVNQEPHKKWIEERDGRKYLPIGVVETLMQRVFSRFRVEVKEYKMICNSISVCVRVHFWNPALQEWDWQDGLGAVPIQIKNPDKKNNVSAIDFAQMQTLAVQMGLPGAESFAVKDACEKIGKLFGRDISRKHIMDYTDLYIVPEEPLDLGKEGMTKA